MLFESHKKIDPIIIRRLTNQAVYRLYKNYFQIETSLCFLALGNIEITEILLDAGANPNVENDSQAPIFEACRYNHVIIIELLLKHNANTRLVNAQGYTPIHIGAISGHADVVRELVKAGVSHDERSRCGNTPLSCAAQHHHFSVVKELLPLGCNVNNKDKDADTPLLYAAFNGMTRCVELLLENGADPNSPNRVGATPLWNAVYMGHEETVKKLLKTNVVMERSSVGIDQSTALEIYDTPKTPLWVAVQRGFNDIVLLLLAAGYDVHKEMWIYQNNFPEVQNVIDANPDANQESSEQLRSILLNASQNPFKLITLCRNTLRNLFGEELKSMVQNLDMPIALQNYLTLADLKYTVDEKKEEVNTYDLVIQLPSTWIIK